MNAFGLTNFSSDRVPLFRGIPGIQAKSYVRDGSQDRSSDLLHLTPLQYLLVQQQCS